MYVVYKHTCPNGKIYIGITSQKLNQRWRKGKGYSKNILFNRAINKYGWESITHEILYENLTKEEAEQKEIELIVLYKSNNPKHGYNIDNGGNTVGKLSEATKQKISEANKGRHKPPFTEEHCRKIGEAKKGSKRPDLSERNKLDSIPVVCLDTGIIYESSREAERQTGAPHSSIIRVCNKEYGRKTAGGYHWEYLKEKEFIDKENNYMENYQEVLTNVYNEIKNYLDKVNIPETNIKFISCLYDTQNTIQTALQPALIAMEELSDTLKESLDKIYAALPTKEEIAYWQEYQRSLFNELANGLYEYEKIIGGLVC